MNSNTSRDKIPLEYHSTFRHEVALRTRGRRMHAQRFHGDAIQHGEIAKLLERGRLECFLDWGILERWRQYHQFIAESRLQS
jgi:hypothetical protein